MQLIELICLGVALGTDAFSVSVAVGMNRINWSLILKLSLVIAVFHVIMPLLGINLAQLLDHFFGHYYFEETIKNITSVIGAGLLIILGTIMIVESRQEREYGDFAFDLSLWGIIILAVSVSIDALSVGFSLGMLNVKILCSCLVLGSIAGLMVLFGLLLGKKIGLVLATKAQIIGGIVLIFLGLHFLFS
ncbi:manganese efflux pump MntP [Halanaerobacter jeridensis]|uniref:Putative manganese efflux pump MntP n=1 Tax=Halanaerobacter jeridensis TaxID=706427 RepID=A0A938XPI5_9FIRM|nr:manganese efflux pump MntP family protein [Halanaerobacter jeridensis]MBM7557023.1 putative Mn2+ efflux pump MntP [Halanaerobacter jeridensis]